MNFQGDIWSTGLNLSMWEVERLTLLLSPDEMERANRFKFEPHRRRFIVARARLRDILAGYLYCHPKEIIFHYSPHGKPELPDSKLFFNVSHSHELAIYAIGWDGPVGIDIEFIRPVDSLLSLIERYFHLLEQEEVERSPNADETFFKFWTAKEAYLKATGEGIGGGLRHTQVSLNPLRLVNIQGWSLQRLALNFDYVATLCYRSLD